MAYTKQNWRRLKSELIPVEPENLEQIEDGIVELESRIQAGLGEVETITTTTKADYLIEKPTEDFKVLEKVPFEEGVTYEAVVTVDEVEYSYSVQLVDGASLDFDYYDLTGFKVLTCGTLLGTDAKGLMIIQDCIASLSPLNATKTDGYSSVYSTFDKVVIKDVYVNTEATYKIKNQDEKYAKAFQADTLCTDEKDVSFIKNNPIQKELVKTRNKGYEIAVNATNFEVLLEDDLIKIGYVKDTVANSKIDFDVETLTATISSTDGVQTFELAVRPGEDWGLPKAATVYVAEDFMDYPLIIRGLTKFKLVDDQLEFAGAVDAEGLPLYDADGEMVADNNALFILSFYQPESLCAIFNSVITINETLTEEVEKEHFTVTEQFVKDFQADFSEGDSTKIGFIKNMPFYSANKNLPGFTIAEPLPSNEDFKLLTGTTKNSLLLNKDGNYEITLFEVHSDGTIDGESLYGVYPGIVYNRAEILEAMQSENFTYAIPESEIATLDSVLPADCAMLAIDDGDIIPLIFTHIHMSIAENGSLQVVTDENAEENYFTYLNFGGTDTLINITGKNIPENNYKFKQIKKLPSEFLGIENSVSNYLDPYDSEKAVSGYGIWQYINDRLRTQVLSTSDGHINFVKADDGSRNIDFSVETTGIGYNEDLQTVEQETIVGAINELVDELHENKLQVADSGINNIYYTDKNGEPQEQLLKQNFVAAADNHTCYEALLNDTNIYWCPPSVGSYIYGISTKTFNIYSLRLDTKTINKVAVVKDIEIKDTLTQFFSNSPNIVCVDLHTSSTTEKWVHKSSISSQFDRQFTKTVKNVTYLDIYTSSKQCISVGFENGIVKYATTSDLSETLANLPLPVVKTGASIYSASSNSAGASRTEYDNTRKYTVTPYYSSSYRRNILTQGKSMGSASNTGANYIIYSTSLDTLGDITYSNFQPIITSGNYTLVAQRALNSEGVEIYSYDEGTEYTGIDNNTHSTYIFLKPSESADINRPFCLTSAGEAIWRDLQTGEILARKTVQTDSSDLFTPDTLRTTKLYYCAENKLLYVVNSTSIYAINIYDENPIATVVRVTSTDFTFNDNCYLIGFGENFVLLANGGDTLKVVQIRESFNCNELKLGDTAQDKIVLKDVETGDLYNLVIKNGQVVIEAVTA